MSSTRRRRIRAHQRRELVAREAPRRRDATAHPAREHHAAYSRAVFGAITVAALLAVLVILLVA
jgi:hypothetical protein